MSKPRADYDSVLEAIPCDKYILFADLQRKFDVTDTAWFGLIVGELIAAGLVHTRLGTPGGMLIRRLTLEELSDEELSDD